MKFRRSLFLTCSSSFALVCLAAPHASAQTNGTWSGASGATWNSTATNWTGVSGTPWDSTNGSTANATFSGSNSASVSGTVFVNRIDKTNTAGNTAISSGNITLAGSTPTITNNSTSSLSISSVLTGSNGVTVSLLSGAGTAGGVTFVGNNTYSGTTTINGSNNGLTVADNNALGTSSVLVNSFGILKVATSALSNNITINGGASNGAIQTFTSSTLSGLITLASDAAIGNRGDGSTLNLTGGIAASGQRLSLSGVGGSSSTIISNNVVNLGSGGIFRASAQPVTVNIGGNTWGTTVVDWTGKINLGATNALATASILQMGATGGGETATVDLKGFNQSVAGLRSFTGTGSASASGTRTITSNTAATLTIDNSSGTSYLYDGVISGNLSLTKSGSAAQTLSGNNTYTGTTTVSGNGSILAISNANALGATSGNTTVGNRAELRLSGGISVGESITLNGFGAVRNSNAALTNTSGTNTVTGLITLGTEASENWIASTGGTLNLTGGVSSPNRDLSLTGGGGLNVTTNAINLGTGNLIVFGQSGTSASIGVASNTASLLTVYYSGKLRMDVANAFSSSTGLYMGSADNSAGSLDLNGNSQTFGSLESYGTGTVVITSASAATLSVDQTATKTYTGTITGAVGLIKSGASTLTLSGNNTYNGGTTVNAGNLNVSSTGSLASGSAFTLGDSAAAILSNSGQTLGAVSNSNSATNALNFSATTGTVTLASLSGAGNTRFGSNAVVTAGIGSGTVTAIGSLTANIAGGTTTVGGVATIGTMSAGTANLNGATSSIGTYNGGNIALGNSTVLSVSGGSSAGVISGGGSLTKTGAGSLELLGANTYSGGTTVSEGTLAINGSVAGAVAVNSNTTLQGAGSIGGALSVSGQLSPGNSIESIGASSVSFLSGSTYAYELNSSVLGGDLLYTTGALSIASTTTLSLTELASGTLAMNDKLTLISYGTWNGGLFTYNGSTLNNGDKFTLGSNEWLFKYDDTTGGNNFLSDQTGASGYITMTVIPEPNVAMVAGSLALMTLLRRRRD